ncbi:MAG: sulfotransferase domain-containing protein [Bacteroidales bacterium]|nr:sulfotransferase domain-containing protein [Bacteroidales bacterium]MCM1414522.1 sulfotransferase domain-containing protein [bacterium]MCM1422573.1 sulfotransferase domain-containing protein [bacterium]
MSEKELIAKNIRKYFKENENEKIVILPFWDFANTAREILQTEYGIQEQFMIDSYAYDLKHIYPVDRMPEGYEECTFFLTAYGGVRKTLRKMLLQYVSEERIVDLLYDEEREAVFQSNSKVHFDFLCTGFAKCGTTSLHYALTQNPRFFLPEIKETSFLRFSVNEATHEAFKNHYGEKEIKGKLVGGIEPSYKSCAEEVYRYFGSDLKIIFCVRNPADMLYSYFRMAMRNNVSMFGPELVESALLEQYGRVCAEMFDQWADRYREKGRYVDCIMDYLEHYSGEQIKIIVSEELYADTDGVMNELQDFLGLSEKERRHYNKFPQQNIGDRVVRDKQSLEINRELYQLRLTLMQMGNSQALELFTDVSKKIEDLTMIEYQEPMLASTRKKLMDYYMDDIRKLEEIMGRSLKTVWY